MKRPTPHRVKNMNTGKINGTKTRDLPREGRLAPAGSRVTLRVTERVANVLLNLILMVQDMVGEVADMNKDWEWQDAFQRSVESLMRDVFGAERCIYWDEYGIIVPIKYGTKRAFLILFNAGPYEGTYRIFAEDTEEYQNIMRSFEEYSLSTKPIMQVVE